MKHPQTWLGGSRLLLAMVALPLGSQAEELAPDDPSIAGSLGVWLNDTASNFDAETGTWADSSGNDRHAVPDEIDSAGTETSTSVPTFSGGGPPFPLPQRVSFQVREL